MTRGTPRKWVKLCANKAAWDMGRGRGYGPRKWIFAWNFGAFLRPVYEGQLNGFLSMGMANKKKINYKAPLESVVEERSQMTSAQDVVRFA